jgi:hypothetical protein
MKRSLTCRRKSAIARISALALAMARRSWRLDPGLGLFRRPFAAAAALPAGERGPVDASQGLMRAQCSLSSCRSREDRGRRSGPYRRPAATRFGFFVRVTIAVLPIIDFVRDRGGRVIRTAVRRRWRLVRGQANGC